jgi:hypothetical protein
MGLIRSDIMLILEQYVSDISTKDETRVFRCRLIRIIYPHILKKSVTNEGGHGLLYIEL